MSRRCTCKWPSMAMPTGRWPAFVVLYFSSTLPVPVMSVPFAFARDGEAVRRF